VFSIVLFDKLIGFYGLWWNYKYWERRRSGWVWLVVWRRLCGSVVVSYKRSMPRAVLWVFMRLRVCGLWVNLSSMPFYWLPWPPNKKTVFFVLKP